MILSPVGAAAAPAVVRSSTSTQSAVPALLLPGVEKDRDPEFASPAPIVVYAPLVGSSQRAREGPLIAAMSRLIAPLCPGGR